jgi:hypothetical protein
MPSDVGDRGRLLDHAQSIIERLAGNSFSIKGWAVTFVSVFLGFGVKDAKPQVAFSRSNTKALRCTHRALESYRAAPLPACASPALRI